MNAISLKKISSVIPFNVKAAQQTVEFLGDKIKLAQAILISEEDITNIVGRLHNYPEVWIYVPPSHPWHLDILGSIYEQFDKLDISPFATFIIDSDHRTMVVFDHDHVLPCVFEHRLDFIRLWRLVGNREARWLITLAEVCRTFIKERRGL